MQPPRKLEVSVISQFIKDLSFENFNTINNSEKSSQLEYNININVKIEKEHDPVSQVILYLFCEAFHIKDKVYNEDKEEYIYSQEIKSILDIIRRYKRHALDPFVFT